MKFSCEKSMLQDACTIASRAVPPKSPMSSLEGMKIEVSGNSIRVTGYDLKKAIFTTLEASVEEEGTVLVNSRFFGEMLRRMPDGILKIENDERGNLRARCGRSDYNFPGLDVSEYPELPEIDPKHSVEIPQNILKDMINRTIFAVSKDEIRPIYTGSLFEIEGNNLTMVSVDGYRLARKTASISTGLTENCSFVVPGFSLTDIEKVCGETDTPARICVGEKHISFTIESTVIITRRLEGDFLNHRKSVPENFRYLIKIKKQDMISAIERVSLMLNDSGTTPVKVTLGDGMIEFLCVSPIGKAEDQCTCEGSGDDLQIGFNDRYLLDALKAAEKDELYLCINTPSSPCVIKAADGTEFFTYMILPVRLRSN